MQNYWEMCLVPTTEDLKLKVWEERAFIWLKSMKFRAVRMLYLITSFNMPIDTQILTCEKNRCRCINGAAKIYSYNYHSEKVVRWISLFPVFWFGDTVYFTYVLFYIITSSKVWEINFENFLRIETYLIYCNVKNACLL